MPSNIAKALVNKRKKVMPKEYVDTVLKSIQFVCKDCGGALHITPRLK